MNRLTVAAKITAAATKEEEEEDSKSVLKDEIHLYIHLLISIYFYDHQLYDEAKEYIVNIINVLHLSTKRSYDVLSTFIYKYYALYYNHDDNNNDNDTHTTSNSNCKSHHAPPGRAAVGLHEFTLSLH